MPKYQVTFHYCCTVEIEAPNEDAAIALTGEIPVSGADLISDGYLSTTVERLHIDGRV